MWSLLTSISVSGTIFKWESIINSFADSGQGLNSDYKGLGASGPTITPLTSPKVRLLLLSFGWIKYDQTN